MTRRLAILTLSVYPLAFRRRYGDEMRALLEQSPPRVLTLLDLMRGALAAHLRPPEGLGDVLDAGARLRASTSGVLACWLTFAAAGFGFYKATEDGQFSAAGNVHAVLGGAHVAVQIFAAVASFAIVAGALPLILAALRHARRAPGLRILVSLPVAAVIAFAGVTGLLILLANSQHSRQAGAGGRGAFIAWILAGLVCGGICVVTSRKALFATPVPGRWLAAALAWGTLVTAAMAAMALATALYTIALQLDAATLAGEQNGPLGFTSTTMLLTVDLVFMVISGALAMITVRRGWRALSAPD